MTDCVYNIALGIFSNVIQTPLQTLLITLEIFVKIGQVVFENLYTFIIYVQQICIRFHNIFLL